ncbi:MAG: helix-hairpin-helix domain-containing protein [Bacteroidia bacterium]|nr:helix-hairpin-helix domain-containing protein [Bacteroidia bacterium]
MKKEFLQFSRSAQRGIVTLSILVALTIIARFWPIDRPDPEVTFHYIPVESSEDSFQETTSHNYPTKRQWQLKSFDINYAKARDLRQMGFQDAFIQDWFERKNEIGFVVTPEQFKELKLMEDSDLGTVLPYLDFTRYRKKPTTLHTKHREIQFSLDINSADSTEFKRLHGIGNVLSKRIVRYRSALGGFVSFDQLTEVYGVDSSLVNRLMPYLELNDAHQLLDINHMDVNTLAHHPYVSWKQARAIVQYRQQHGGFASTDDLNQVHLLTREWVDQIAPYLAFL